MGGGAVLARRAFLAGAAAFGTMARTAFAADVAPVRDTVEGPVRGAADGDTLVFRGIPFARPPVGALRFRPPAPPLVRQGVLDATRFAPTALQVMPGAGAPTLAGMSEDCLALNIYAPVAPGPHPVFVWIHGGGNSNGSTAHGADGTVFARRGIVCVTIAYRLGAFGFLELGDLLGLGYAGSGDNALCDQVAALRWVRANIAAFGGDPARVTVGGVSAGAKDTVSLCASPLARGLFDAAIVDSGGVTACDVAEAGRTARAFAAALPTDVAARDLPTASPAVLLAAQQKLIAGFGRPFPFRAVTGTDALPRPALDALRAAPGVRRMLIGTARDESILFVARPTAAEPLAQRDLANLDLAVAAPVAAAYDRAYPDLDPLRRRIRFVTAEEYGEPSIRVAEAASAGGAAVWFYRFDRPARTGPFAGWVGHGFQVPYVWQSATSPELAPIVGAPDAEAQHLADEMTDRWCAFIRGDAPDRPGAARWPRFDGRRILRFAGATGTPGTLDAREHALWHDVRFGG